MKFCQKQKPAVLQVSKARVLPGLVEQKLNLIMLGKEKVTFRECLEVAAHQAGLVWTLEGEEGDSDLDRDWKIHRGAVSLVIPQTTHCLILLLQLFTWSCARECPGSQSPSVTPQN